MTRLASVFERLDIIRRKLTVVESAAVPVGTPLPWLVSTVPSGYLEFNGQSTAGYPVLASLFGATLPDLRDRFLVGASGTKAVGSTGGAETVTLTAAQSGLPAHTHSMPVAGVGVVANRFTSGTTETNTYVTGGVTGGAQNASSSHENKPPYHAVRWITRAA